MSRPADLGEVRTIYSLLRAFTRPWYFAGGWALDLYLGKKTRPHEDVEIVVFRRDQFALREYLVGWSFQKAIPGEKRLEPWSEGELLGPPIHEVHCTDSEHELEILFEEADLASVLPFLDERRRSWLRDAVAACHPGHPWLTLIASRSSQID